MARAAKTKKTTQGGTLDGIFKPRSIAVIGATTRRGSIGREILSNLFDGEFNGKIFPVNPRYEYIHSTKAYPTVLAIPDPVDLAVVVVPKEAVPQAVEDCARKGVKGLVIISAGFRETGPEGVAREEAVLAVARAHGMRMIGPNCMGVIDMTPGVRMNATFSPGIPAPGSLAFMTQSGALGVAILLAAQKLQLGVSYFASVGNKADVSAVDLLEYWEDDPHTGVIALYLESFGDPKRFTELSKRISIDKPIIVVKSGTTAAGARAASSHTGSLAGKAVAVDALLRHCGVVRVSTIDEMIDLVAGFTRAPVPAGNRVCIVTNAGGPAIMAADATESLGLEIAQLDQATRERVAAELSPEASVANPIDMIAGATPDDYERTLGLVLEDDNVDIVIVIFVPPLMVDPIDVMGRVTRAARGHGKTVLSVLMAEEKYSALLPEKIEDVVPFYQFPESAVKVAAAMNSYARWRETPRGSVVRFDVDRAAAQGIVDKHIAAGGGYLSATDTFDVLRAYGFPACASERVDPGGSIADAAHRIGYPVVLKADTDALVHKSDVGGVVVGIDDDAALEAARNRMDDDLRKAGIDPAEAGYLVQEQAEAGAELILGMAEDATFGPLVMFGMGGKYVEILGDVAFRAMPLTDVDGRDFVASIKSYPLLEGVRGEAGVDIEFVIECVLRLAQLTSEIDGILELDINPMIVSPQREKCRVVDARIRVGR